MADAWFGLFFGGMMLLVGLFCVVGVLLTYLKLSRVRHWRTVPGRITRSKIELDTSFGLESSNYVYENDIVYEYEVAGKHYSSKKITPFFLNTDQSGRSAKVAQKYPVGQMVTVYYNPAGPQDSLLEPNGLRWVGVLVMVVMLGGMLFGWMFVREALPVLFGR